MSSDRYGDRDKGRDSQGDRKSGRFHDTNQNDAKSIRCRIFVGNLNTDSLTRPEFEAFFAKHGKIVGSSIHNGFGFIQYDKEVDADIAVVKLHGTSIKDRRVDVNLAGDRRKPDKERKRGSPTPEGKSGGFGRARDRSPSPSRRGPLGFRERSPIDRGDRSPYGSPRDGYSRPDDGYPTPPRPEPYPIDELSPKRMRPDYDRPPLPKDPLPPTGTPIDCEIIIINKQQRDYADEVEKKIRSRGLVVECAHLPETVSLSTELEDASRRGVLYGIIITSQHKVHRSVTVHILHGTQQEHRNMPLEDAINLVARNFDIYMQALREREREKEQSPPVEAYETTKDYGGPPGPPVRAGPYGPEVAQLLNIAADGKLLTADEYTDVINELTAIRDDTLKKEGRPVPSSDSTSKPFPTDPQSIALQQAELQAKILSILNPGGNNKAKADTKTTSTLTTEAKPAIKIPVLTPSYSSSPAFKTSESTLASQAAALPKSSGTAASQYTSNIIGMALSNLRGASGQAANRSTSVPSYTQSPTAYASVSSGYPSNSTGYAAGYPSSAYPKGSPYAPGMIPSPATQAWPSPQYRMPSTAAGSSIPGYGARGGYPTGAMPNTYRRY